MNRVSRLVAFALCALSCLSISVWNRTNALGEDGNRRLQEPRSSYSLAIQWMFPSGHLQAVDTYACFFKVCPYLSREIERVVFRFIWHAVIRFPRMPKYWARRGLKQAKHRSREADCWPIAGRIGASKALKDGIWRLQPDPRICRHANANPRPLPSGCAVHDRPLPPSSWGRFGIRRSGQWRARMPVSALLVRLPCT